MRRSISKTHANHTFEGWSPINRDTVRHRREYNIPKAALNFKHPVPVDMLHLRHGAVPSTPPLCASSKRSGRLDPRGQHPPKEMFDQRRRFFAVQFARPELLQTENPISRWGASSQQSRPRGVHRDNIVFVDTRPRPGKVGFSTISHLYTCILR